MSKVKYTQEEISKEWENYPCVIELSNNLGSETVITSTGVNLLLINGRGAG